MTTGFSIGKRCTDLAVFPKPYTVAVLLQEVRTSQRPARLSARNLHD